jgi:hypothetical protein
VLIEDQIGLYDPTATPKHAFIAILEEMMLAWGKTYFLRSSSSCVAGPKMLAWGLLYKLANLANIQSNIPKLNICKIMSYKTESL